MIEIEFDRPTLDLVLRAFRYMRDEPGIVDWSMPVVSSKEKLKALVDMMEDAAGSSEDTVVLSMRYSKWCGYTNFVYYAHDVIPSEEDSRRLYELWIRYEDWEENDFKPRAPRQSADE